LDTGRTIAEVAREIGLVEQTLNRWVAKERASTAGPVDRLLDVDERTELERLRRENQQLRMDVEFLGKASAFFASRYQSRSSSS
jgi:transposase